MLSDFDRKNIGPIIADRAGVQYTWTTAHVIRFLNQMLGKGIDTFRMARLYELFPEETIALLHYWDWSEQSIKDRISEWNRVLVDRGNLADKIMREFG
jgi:hypothetical protein